MDKAFDTVTILTRGKGKVELKNNRSHVLKAKIHSRVLINTFDQPLVNTESTLYCHLSLHLIDTQSTPWMTLD